MLLAALCVSCSSPRRAPLARDLRWSAAASGVNALPATARGAHQDPAIDPDADYRSGFFATNGIYLGARAHWSVLGGDFDGDTSLVGPDTISIPDADDGLGYELALGWEADGWATELSYTRITYDGSLGASDADIDYQAITWNVFRYLRANESVQPYFLMGLVFPWIELEDASTDGVVVGDAELMQGFGIDAGLGLAWWLGSRLALDVRALGTYQVFEEAEGVSGDSETIDDGVEGPSFGISVGLTWVLGKLGGAGS